MFPRSRCNSARSFATGGRGLGQTLVVALLLTATLAPAAEPLAGTKPLTLEGDIAAHLLDGAHKFVDREIERSVERRQRHWKRDFSSSEAYDKSVQPNRERLAKSLGIQWPRVSDKLASIQTHSTLSPVVDFKNPPLPPTAYGVYNVFWPITEGVLGQALNVRRIAQIHTRMRTVIILLPDSGRSPEDLLGYTNSSTWEKGLLTRIERMDPSLSNQFDFEIVVPRIISNELMDMSSLKGLRQRSMSQREFIYRQSFEVGQSVPGYDVQSILQLIDCYKNPSTRVVLHGQGNATWIALATAAISSDVHAVSVSGDFRPRRATWEQPIDRNMWGLLEEFGDAEVASLVAPRPIIVCDDDKAVVSTAESLPGSTPGLAKAATNAEFRSEVERLRTLVPQNTRINSLLMRDLSHSASEQLWLKTICEALGLPASAQGSESRLPSIPRVGQFSDTPALSIVQAIAARQRKQVAEWTNHTQALIRESEYVRRDFMKDADRKSRDPVKWHASVEQYRKYFYDEVIGRFEHDLKPFNAQTRQVYDTDKYRGYEVTLDVFDDVIAYGVLLVPKDIKPGEQRPVVVCQHGLEGRPQDTIEKDIPGERYYHQFAAKLAERGFVTFAPQNLYIFKDRFRELQRKLNPLKKTLFSLIVPQHEQICRWLKSQPFVDGSRIGFYGLSYGGKTAMRVPPLVDHYSCVICSGDFNDWIRKCTSIRDSFSYVGTGEYEIWEWNLANTFNYAEMAGLICPRPFMVERGHRDGVGLDSWVDYEYAKVRLLYVDLKIPERTEIEHFDGPHEINGVGSYKFLHKHLNWPEPK